MNKLITICTWIARITSVLLGVFIMLVSFTVLGGGKSTSLTDFIGFFFMVTLVVGLFLSWPWELPGIIMSYIGIAGIIVLMLIKNEHDIFNIFYTLIPTTILLMCRIARQRYGTAKTT